MNASLKSIIDSGTKLWLDSVDPDEVIKNRDWGATGATSNPIIIADLIRSGRFDDQLAGLAEKGLTDDQIAWELTDQLVKGAQQVFLPVWEQTKGNDGYVSFELDPLLEDADAPPHDERVARYIELGKKWAQGHQNRMIKVPATPAGLDALEELAAAGITLNVTLIFSKRQYVLARDAVWRGAQRRDDPTTLKSVYSIFVSRVDVYTQKNVTQLSDSAQGQVGIVNAKQIYKANQEFWADKNLSLQQEMIFASTGTKNPNDPPDKYVESFVGSDIQTNPPATNEKIAASGKIYTSKVDQLPPDTVVAEIEREVDEQQLEETLMSEGLQKFADPQKALLKLITDKRQTLTTVN